MVAPPGEDRIAYERAWWRGVVRDTFRATDQTASFRDFEAMFEELWRHFADAASWRLRPGCRACLGALRDGGLVLGVLSNFDHRLPAILDGLGIAPLFGAVVLPGDAGAAKPDPRCFAAGLAALGLEAGQTAYVGDDPEQDVAGARAAGLRVVDVAELPSLTALPDRLANLETASGPLRSL